MTTTLLLVRHGETDWNRDGRVQGHSDVPLNETGQAQAEALAEELRDEPVGAIYSSDLCRALDTAEAVAVRVGRAVEALPGLREKHFGTWEGLTREEILARFPDAVAGRWGDGETREQMDVRVLATLEAIAARHDDETVVVVTHGGPLRTVQRKLELTDEAPIVNCHVLRVAVEAGRFAAVAPQPMPAPEA